MENLEAKKWIERLLPMAIAKCGSLTDAEDLVQETILAVLAYRASGRTVENTDAFLSAVLRRKFYDQLRRKYQLPTVSIDMEYDLMDDEDFVAKILSAEEAELVRREVAYLAESYRSMIAKHYFHGKSIKSIAKEFGIPEGTVKSRLNFGLKQLKKGFETMENYTENSYMPKHLRISFGGTCGLNDEPMLLVEGDILAQNLLILAYEKPLTVTELSKAIGVAAAFIEPVIKKLVDGELMRRMGDGKVYTDFIIYHSEDYVMYMKEQEAFAETYADIYCDAAEAAIEELKQSPFYSQRLERFLLIEIAQNGLLKCNQSFQQKQKYPTRPNGGQWNAFGNLSDPDYIIPEEKRGKEEYEFAGLRSTHSGRYLDGKDLILYNFETSLYPYPKHSGFGYQSFSDVEFDLIKLFYLIKHKIAPETVDFSEKMLKSIPLLEERGFLTRKNGSPELLIPCLTHAEMARFWKIAEKASDSFAEKIREPYSEYVKTHRKTIPAHLKSVPEFRLTTPYEPNAMMFVYQAIYRGVHPRDLGYPCPETVVVLD